ncbi:hypothetical protein WJX77_002053 [Trebouxia sp. C0004]
MAPSSCSAIEKHPAVGLREMGGAAEEREQQEGIPGAGKEDAGLVCQLPTFWSMLKLVLLHLEPLLIAVRAVESEQTKLDRVLKLLGYLHQHFSGVLDAKVRQVMLDGSEKRFAEYDQPALLIACMLNPQRQQLFLDPSCDFVSWRNAVILVETQGCFFPDAAEALKAVVADQILA